MAGVTTMPKRKPTACADDKEVDLVHVWLPLFEAHVLLGVAFDLEDDERYAERARALIKAAQPHVDAALKLVEKMREGRGGSK